MILRSLHLENYKQYGSLDLEFREGLVGVIGRNGAGKSTLFEAILYCLFGRDESSKTLIRSAFADPKATVVLALQFAVGPAEYAVKREFRGKTMAVNAELFKNDQLIAKGVTPVNDEIGKLLNMERDAFKRSVFSGQSELAELSNASGETRKQMIRKMLGLDNLDKAQTRMNADVRDRGNQIAGQRQNLLEPEAVAAVEVEISEYTKALEANALDLKKERKSLKSVEEEYQEARRKFEAEEQRQKRHLALEQEIGRLQERIEGLARQQEGQRQKLTDLAEQSRRLSSQQDAFAAFEKEKKNLRQLEDDRRRHLNRQANQLQLDELQTPLAEARARLQNLETSLRQSAGLDAAIGEKQRLAETIEHEIEQKRESFSALKSRADALTARIDDRRAKVEQLGAIGREGTCPTCFQPVLDAYDDVLAQLNAEITALQTRELADLEQQKQQITQAGLDLRTNLTDAKNGLAALQAEAARVQELAKQKAHEEATLKQYEAQVTRIQLVLREIGTVEFDEQAFAALKETVERKEPLYLQFSNENAYVARETPATQAALKQTEAALAEAQKHKTQRLEDLSHTGFDAAQFDGIRQTLARFGDAYAAQSSRVGELEKNDLELQNHIARRREKLRANADIQAQLSAKAEEVELLRKLSELLLQFKTEILEKISPGISREASDLFSRITRGKYERIHVDENFDFSIADGGVLYPIERFSGGEIDLANFCLRIAVTKAIMELSGNGQGVEFLAFDEIFGSQDEERRHEMMLALNYLQEQFRQIYIVSHIDSQKDYFPNLLEVAYRPEGSVVKWV